MLSLTSTGSTTTLSNIFGPQAKYSSHAKYGVIGGGGSKHHALTLAGRRRRRKRRAGTTMSWPRADSTCISVRPSQTHSSAATEVITERKGAIILPP